MKFALAGNPNCGKTTLFNALTGSTAHVGNWPGVTVDKREGVYKKLSEPIEIVDLPGIYSLSPYTPEEVVTRNFIIDERPDCVIDIVDATNLERNLYLTTQILEMDVPVVIALNMMDEVEKSGGKIDVALLKEKLGVPVLEISALRNKGINELMKAAQSAAGLPRKGTFVYDGILKEIVEKTREKLIEENIVDPLFHAVKLIEGDELEVADHKDIIPFIEKLKQKRPADLFEGDFEAIIADARYRYLSVAFASLQRKKELNSGLSRSDKIDKVLTHRIWGIPIFLFAMLFIFHLTFSSDLLFLSAIIPQGSFDLPVIGTDAIASPGVLLQGAMQYLTDDLIGANLAVALSEAPQWLSGLILNGLWAGVSTVLSFIPQIMLLFVFLFVLEDSGYMARVAFIMDRAFRKIGLSGRAFMPLLMCFGCAVPGMMATRTLGNERERQMTVMLAPYFSCGAKLPIWTVFAAVLFGGAYGDLVVYGMYLLGIVVAIAAAFILSKTAMRGEMPPFIMELPTYHAPRAKNIGSQLWEKLKHYLVRAATVIAASVVVIWFFTSFNFWDGYVGENVGESLLAYIGKGLAYLFWPLGWGQGDTAWMFTVATLTGLVAKEMVVATMGTLSSMYVPAAEMLASTPIAALIESISVPAAFSFMAFNLLSIPCMASVAAALGEYREGKARKRKSRRAKKASCGCCGGCGSGENCTQCNAFAQEIAKARESEVASGIKGRRHMKKSSKKFWGTIAFWLITAYLVSAMIYWIGTYWWTLFIFASLFALFAVLYMGKEKYQKRKKAALDEKQ